MRQFRGPAPSSCWHRHPIAGHRSWDRVIVLSRGDMMRVRVYGVALLVSLLAGARFSKADEGMWTFDNPPLKLLQDKYKFTPTPQWLDHIRLSSVRFNDGGSGSFVSANGLVITNHHVAFG